MLFQEAVVCFALSLIQNIVCVLMPDCTELRMQLVNKYNFSRIDTLFSDDFFVIGTEVTGGL